MPEKKLLSEENILWIFDISLWIKGVFAFVEILGGIAAFFVTKEALVSFTLWVFRDELVDDPHDALANFFLHSAQSVSLSAQDFTGIYLLSHGAVKLWLIVGLLRKRLWYYPVAIIVFGLFILYQMYRYSFTHSAWLLVLTALDLIVIGLTWHEYRYLRRVTARS